MLKKKIIILILLMTMISSFTFANAEGEIAGPDVIFKPINGEIAEISYSTSLPNVSWSINDEICGAWVKEDGNLLISSAFADNNIVLTAKSGDTVVTKNIIVKNGIYCDFEDDIINEYAKGDFWVKDGSSKGTVAGNDTNKYLSAGGGGAWKAAIDFKEPIATMGKATVEYKTTVDKKIWPNYFIVGAIGSSTSDLSTSNNGTDWLVQPELQGYSSDYGIFTGTDIDGNTGHTQLKIDSIKLGQWVTIKLELDFTEHTYDMFVNDVKYVDDYKMFAQAKEYNFQKLRFHSMIDNLNIYSGIKSDENRLSIFGDYEIVKPKYGEVTKTYEMKNSKNEVIHGDFDINPKNDGISISQDGILTIADNAISGGYEISATASGETAKKKIKIENYKLILSIQGEDSFNIKNPKDVIISKYSVFNQNNEEENCIFEVIPTNDNINIDNDGYLTVFPTVASGEYTINATSVYDNNIKIQKKIMISKMNYNIVGEDIIAKPMSNCVSDVTYKLVDDAGNEHNCKFSVSSGETVVGNNLKITKNTPSNIVLSAILEDTMVAEKQISVIDGTYFDFENDSVGSKPSGWNTTYSATVSKDLSGNKYLDANTMDKHGRVYFGGDMQSLKNKVTLKWKSKLKKGEKGGYTGVVLSTKNSWMTGVSLVSDGDYGIFSSYLNENGETTPTALDNIKGKDKFDFDSWIDVSVELDLENGTFDFYANDKIQFENFKFLKETAKPYDINALVFASNTDDIEIFSGVAERKSIERLEVDLPKKILKSKENTSIKLIGTVYENNQVISKKINWSLDTLYDNIDITDDMLTIGDTPLEKITVVAQCGENIVKKEISLADEFVSDFEGDIIKGFKGDIKITEENNIKYIDARNTIISTDIEQIPDLRYVLEAEIGNDGFFSINDILSVKIENNIISDTNELPLKSDFSKVKFIIDKNKYSIIVDGQVLEFNKDYKSTPFTQAQFSLKLKSLKLYSPKKSEFFIQNLAIGGKIVTNQIVNPIFDILNEDSSMPKNLNAQWYTSDFENQDFVKIGDGFDYKIDENTVKAYLQCKVTDGTTYAMSTPEKVEKLFTVEKKSDSLIYNITNVWGNSKEILLNTIYYKNGILVDAYAKNIIPSQNPVTINLPIIDYDSIVTFLTDTEDLAPRSCAKILKGDSQETKTGLQTSVFFKPKNSNSLIDSFVSSGNIIDFKKKVHKNDSLIEVVSEYTILDTVDFAKIPAGLYTYYTAGEDGKTEKTVFGNKTQELLEDVSLYSNEKFKTVLKNLTPKNINQITTAHNAFLTLKDKNSVKTLMNGSIDKFYLATYLKLAIEQKSDKNILLKDELKLFGFETIAIELLEKNSDYNAVISVVNEKSHSSIAVLLELLKETSILKGIENVAYYKDAKIFLSNCQNQRYNNLGEDRKDKIAEILAGKPYKTISELNTAINNAQISDNIGGGGTGGGGGNSRPIISGELTPPKSNDFKDVPEDFWGYKYISEFKEKNIINGDENGNFRPNDTITRAEFSKIVCNALELTSLPELIFTDVAIDSWYAPFITAMYKNKLINGFGDVFMPNDNITREQASTILYRTLDNSNLTQSDKKFSDDKLISEFSYVGVYSLSKAKIINGFSDNTFRPTAFTTRAEAVKMIYETTKILEVK